MSAEAKKIVVEKSLTGLFNLGFHKGQVLTVGEDIDAEMADKILAAGCAYYEGESPKTEVKETKPDKTAASNIITEAENKASEILLKAENDADAIRAEAAAVLEASKTEAAQIIAEAKETAAKNLNVNEAETLKTAKPAKETATDKGAAASEKA